MPPETERLAARAADFVRSGIATRLSATVASGGDPVVAARDVHGWVNPLPIGTIPLPGSPEGRAAAAAKTALRTETTAILSDAKITLAVRKGHFVRWVVAPSHPRADLCDPIANRDDGYGPGVFLAGTANTPPAHPNCRCYLVTVPPDTVSRLTDNRVTAYAARKQARAWYDQWGANAPAIPTKAEIEALTELRDAAGLYDPIPGFPRHGSPRRSYKITSRGPGRAADVTDVAGPKVGTLVNFGRDNWLMKAVDGDEFVHPSQFDAVTWGRAKFWGQPRRLLPDPQAGLFTTADLRAAAKVDRGTMDFYIRERVINPKARTTTDRLLFDQSDIDLLKDVVRLRGTGMKIADVRTTLADRIRVTGHREYPHVVVPRRRLPVRKGYTETVLAKRPKVFRDEERVVGITDIVGPTPVRVGTIENATGGRWYAVVDPTHVPKNDRDVVNLAVQGKENAATWLRAKHWATQPTRPPGAPRYELTWNDELWKQGPRRGEVTLTVKDVDGRIVGDVVQRIDPNVRPGTEPWTGFLYGSGEVVDGGSSLDAIAEFMVKRAEVRPTPAERVLDILNLEGMRDSIAEQVRVARNKLPVIRGKPATAPRWGVRKTETVRGRHGETVRASMEILDEDGRVAGTALWNERDQWTGVVRDTGQLLRNRRSLNDVAEALTSASKPINALSDADLQAILRMRIESGIHDPIPGFTKGAGKNYPTYWLDEVVPGRYTVTDSERDDLLGFLRERTGEPGYIALSPEHVHDGYFGNIDDAASWLRAQHWERKPIGSTSPRYSLIKENDLRFTVYDLNDDFLGTVRRADDTATEWSAATHPMEEMTYRIASLDDAANILVDQSLTGRGPRVQVFDDLEVVLDDARPDVWAVLDHTTDDLVGEVRKNDWGDAYIAEALSDVYLPPNNYATLEEAASAMAFDVASIRNARLGGPSTRYEAGQWDFSVGHWQVGRLREGADGWFAYPEKLPARQFGTRTEAIDYLWNSDDILRENAIPTPQFPRVPEIPGWTTIGDASGGFKTTRITTDNNVTVGSVQELRDGRWAVKFRDGTEADRGIFRTEDDALDFIWEHGKELRQIERRLAGETGTSLRVIPRELRDHPVYRDEPELQTVPHESLDDVVLPEGVTRRVDMSGSWIIRADGRELGSIDPELRVFVVHGKDGIYLGEYPTRAEAFDVLMHERQYTGVHARPLVTTFGEGSTKQDRFTMPGYDYDVYASEIDEAMAVMRDLGIHDVQVDETLREIADLGGTIGQERYDRILDTLNLANKAVHHQQRHGLSLPRRLRLGQLPGEQGTWGQYFHGDDEVVLNMASPIWKSDGDKAAREAFVTEWHPAARREDIVMHEIGHSSHYHEMVSSRRARGNMAREEDIWASNSNWSKAQHVFPGESLPDRIETARSISEYATKNPYEFVAETYSKIMFEGGDQNVGRKAISLYHRLLGPRYIAQRDAPLFRGIDVPDVTAAKAVKQAPQGSTVRGFDVEPKMVRHGGLEYRDVEELHITKDGTPIGIITEQYGGEFWTIRLAGDPDSNLLLNHATRDEALAFFREHADELTNDVLGPPRAIPPGIPHIVEPPSPGAPATLRYSQTGSPVYTETYDDAIEIARQLGVTDLSDDIEEVTPLHLRAMNLLNKVLWRQTEEGLHVPHRISIQDAYDDAPLAAFDPTYNGIEVLVGPQWEEGGSVAQRFRDGHFVSPRLEDVVLHEVGHSAHFADIVPPGMTEDDLEQDHLYLRMMEWMPGLPDRAPEIAGEVSDYARQNPHEFLAEVYAGVGYRGGDGHLSDAVKGLYRRLKGPRYKGIEDADIVEDIATVDDVLRSSPLTAAEVVLGDEVDLALDVIDLAVHGFKFLRGKRTSPYAQDFTHAGFDPEVFHADFSAALTMQRELGVKQSGIDQSMADALGTGGFTTARAQEVLPDAINYANKALKEQLASGQPIPDRIIYHYDKSDNYIGRHIPDSDTVVLNLAHPEWNRDPKVLDAAYDTGFYASRRREDVVMHELAHNAHWRTVEAKAATPKKAEAYWNGTATWEGVPDAPADHLEIARTVSEIASMNPHEFVAEVYTRIKAQGGTEGIDTSVLDLYRLLDGPDYTGVPQS